MMNKLKRIRRWIIWIGGWEKANSSGWKFTIEHTHCNRKTGRITTIHRYLDPTPISLFGNFLTIQPFGIHISTRWGYLCWSWRKLMQERPNLGHCYLSPNATPSAATKWFWGKNRKLRVRKWDD